jgi:lipoprotein-anchoring transpeptidase ErfK/SrfK
VPNVAALDPLAPVPGARPVARVVVSRNDSSLTVEDAGGGILFHAPVTTGSRHDPLPLGTWKVTVVQLMPAFHYNPDLFWDADPAHAKARIAPGPNNPVGTVWIDLTKEHYGIHGTPEPSRIGRTASHGCVRLTNWDANRVALWVSPRTEVIFR